MQTRTTVRSWPAMGLAAVFVGGTSFVLFADVLDGARITTGHVLTALALIAATAAGHQIVSAWRARRFGLLIGLSILTVASLAYVATMSGARNAESVSLKAERQTDANARREAIEAERKAAQGMLDAARRDVARECATGEGPRCRGRKATESVYSAAVAGHDARLAALAPPATPNAGYRATAEAIALTGLTSRPQPEIERALVALMPWLAVLISELGSIVFMSSALGHKSHVELVEIPVEPEPEPGNRAEVIDWVREFKSRNGRNPQIPELQARFRVPKTTAWRRINAA
ncbi:MAG: hypothetical protein AB7L90_10255 [Hyphomicrobiaceae bacterium]